MKTNEELKTLVREKYGEIVTAANTGCGCSCGCGPTDEISIMSEDYSHLEGYVPEADLGLGCGIPTEHADLQEGQTVLDLGSGAGNDVFVARQFVGESGKVIGVDFTPAMVAKARANAAKLGYTNVEFLEGDIEQLPLEASQIDVVVSNCVLNLVPDKARTFQEIYRVLKPGAHFCVSDIVLDGELPPAVASAAAMYAGCVSGALQQAAYLQHIHDAGFQHVEVVKSRSIYLPDSLLLEHISLEEVAAFRASGTGIFSITVKATKPALA